MPVSGIVVSCAIGCADEIAARIAALDGAEVHGVQPESRIVAVVEADDLEDEMAIVNTIQEFDGVVSVQLAYHNFEDLGEEQP